MMRLLSEETFRICRKRLFVICMLAIPLLIVSSQIDALVESYREGESLYSGYALSFLKKGMSADALLFCFPVLCALPYAAAFVDEIKSGAVKSILIRSTRKSYLWSKIIA